MNEKEGFGVVIGRFQSHYLHEGHLHLLNTVYSKHDNVIIFLGCVAGQPSSRDPMDFVTRKLMVAEKFPTAHIFPITDMKSNELWSRALDKKISEVVGMHKVALYGSRDSFISSYTTKRYPAIEIESDIIFSATHLRQQVFDKAMASEEFRAGVIYAHQNRFPSPYITVDIAITEKDNLLLARKPNEEGWRFIGGFVDNKDGTFEVSARREASEETGGQLELSDFTIIGNTRVDDWRYRAAKEKVFTTLYTCVNSFGNPQPSDDIDAVKWVPFHELCNIQIEPEHIPLMEMFLNYISTSNKPNN